MKVKYLASQRYVNLIDSFLYEAFKQGVAPVRIKIVYSLCSERNAICDVQLCIEIDERRLQSQIAFARYKVWKW